MAPSAKPKFPQEVRRTTPSGKVASVCDTAFGPPLRAFREKYDLSTRELACVMSLVQKGPGWATVKSMLHERAGVAVVARYAPAMIAGIENFLRRRGLNDHEISAELSQLFPGENFDIMTTKRSRLDIEHVDHYGLICDPFSDMPAKESEVFKIPALDRILQRLEDAINYQRFAIVVGDIGAGKTVMKHRLIDSVAKSQKMRLFWPEFVEMERVKSGGIVTFLLHCLGQRPARSLMMAQTQLLEVLEANHKAGIRIALGFDEMHHLDLTVWAALKNFLELGTGGFERYLGVVGFGQPQLAPDTNGQRVNAVKRVTARGQVSLDDIRLREIAERAQIIRMPSLSKVATEYVDHRLKLAGSRLSALFDPSAIEFFAGQVSTAQAIGNLCNEALIKHYELGEPGKIKAAFVKSNFGPQVRHIKRT